MCLNRKRKKPTHFARLYRPAKSVLAFVLVLGLIFGVSFRWLYDYRPWIEAEEPNGSGKIDPSGTGVVPTPTPALNTGWLTSNQLAQRILDAVASNTSAQDIYSGIPQAQLDGLTYEEFHRYIGLIDLAMDGVPVSFSPMTVSERDRQITRIIQVDPRYSEIAESSTYHWLETSTGAGSESFAIAIQRNSTGMDYLDHEWVRNVIDLYDYAQTYFGTIKQENAEVLAAMISSASASGEVRLAKARATLDFYDVYSVSTQGLKIKAFDISRIRYTVKSNYNDKLATDTESETDDVTLLNRAALASAAQDGLIESELTRDLQLFRDADDVFRIQDDIPTVSTQEDFDLFIREDDVLHLGLELVSSDVELLLGAPLDLKQLDVQVGRSGDESEERVGNLIHNQDTGSEEQEERSYLFVIYEGIELLIENPVLIRDGAAVMGTLVGYTVVSDRFHTVKGLSVQSTMDEILALYPFIDQTYYRMKNTTLGEYLSFPLGSELHNTDESVRAIRVGRLEELGLGLYEDGALFGTGYSLDMNIEPKSGLSWKSINGEGDTTNNLPVVDRPMAN